MFTGRVLAMLVASTFLGVSVAHAAIITQFTNDQAGFTAAATAGGKSIVTEDFSDTTLATGLTLVSAGGGSISGGILSNAVAVFGLCIDGGTGCPSTTVFDFSPGTTAFGATWDLAPAGAGSGIFFEVTLAGGGTQTITPGILNPPTGGTFSGFYGFVSDTAFTEVRLGSGFTGNGETFNADNLEFAVPGQTTTTTGGSVPEPGTLALLASGLVLVSARLMKRHTS
jgi:PEP-CTERM motif